MVSNIVLGTAETTIIQAASGTQFAVLSLVFCNTTTSEKTVTVYVYPSGGSATDGTTIMKNLAIPPEDSYLWTANEKFILGSLDKISGKASVAASVTVTVNGMAI